MDGKRRGAVSKRSLAQAVALALLVILILVMFGSVAQALPTGPGKGGWTWPRERSTTTTPTTVPADDPAGGDAGISIPPGAVLHEQTSGNLRYQGSWRTAASRSYSGGTASYAFRAGASLTVQFEGTSLTWLSRTSSICGIARVTLDGRSSTLVDLYSAKTAYQQPVYSTGSLDNGVHTLVIEYTGQRNKAASTDRVYVDALYVTGTLTQGAASTATTLPATTTTTVAPTTTTTVAPTTTTTVAPAPTLTITSPTSIGTYTAGSILTPTWNSNQYLSSGEFGVWVRSSSGDWYVSKLVAANGSTRFSTVLTLNVPAGRGYQVIVAYRPTATSPWGSWATSPGSFTVNSTVQAPVTTTTLVPSTTSTLPATTTTATSTTSITTAVATTTTTTVSTTTTTSAPPTSSIAPISGALSVRDYGAKGDGVTDDRAAIQSCINAAAAAGKTAYIPAGTYLIGSQLNLASGVTLRGASAETAIIKMTDKASPTNMIHWGTSTGWTVCYLGFTGVSPVAGNVRAFVGGGGTDCTLHHLSFANMDCVLGNAGDALDEGWHVYDITVRNCQMPLQIGDMTNCLFERMDIQAVNTGTQLDHNIYFSGGLTYCTFNDVTLTGGGGYCLHFYGAGENTTHHLTFNRLSIDSTDGMYPCIICDGYTDLTFNDTTVVANNNQDYKCIFWFYGGERILFDGFETSGTNILAFVPYTPRVEDVEFKNGTHDGTTLASGDGAGEVAMTNVSLR